MSEAVGSQSAECLFSTLMFTYMHVTTQCCNHASVQGVLGVRCSPELKAISRCSSPQRGSIRTVLGSDAGIYRSRLSDSGVLSGVKVRRLDTRHSPTARKPTNLEARKTHISGAIPHAKQRSAHQPEPKRRPVEMSGRRHLDMDVCRNRLDGFESVVDILPYFFTHLCIHLAALSFNSVDLRNDLPTPHDLI